MKILILGCTGMIGSGVLSELSKDPKFKISATYKNKTKKKLLIKKINLNNKQNNINFIEIDVVKTSNYKLKKIISNKDVIINCIGLIKQKINNFRNEKKAIELNSLFPERLNIIRKKKQKIYQITTDCVFNGKKGNYKENDFHNSFDTYGLTKSLGEITEKNFINIRCSIIGKELNSNISLAAWFLGTRNNETVKGYSNHIWNGVTTIVFSKILMKIIQFNLKIPNKIHLIPKDKMSKYQILKYLKKMNNKSTKIIKHKTKIKVDRSLSTNFKRINLMLWKKTFNRQLSIKEILKDYI